MKTTMKNLLYHTGFLILMLFFSGCNKQPKVIAPENPQSSEVDKSSIFGSGSHPIQVDEKPNLGNSELHSVKAIEILPTQKYVYIKVSEGDKEFWIATNKMEIKEGATYFYKGGLLKRNFHSKEYDRVFDKLYLVTSIVPSNHGNNQTLSATKKPEKNKNKNVQPIKDGIIKISELVANPKKYEGKTIQIQGKCTKVNPNIMGRNWIHIKDGTQDDYDMVVTSTTQVPIGQEISFVGKVSLKKDFGSGYYYDILIEQGKTVQL